MNPGWFAAWYSEDAFMKKLAISIVLAIASCSKTEPVAERPPPTSTAKDPAAAKALIERGAVVLDVRTADEYAGGHLSNALNVPVQELSSRMSEIEKLAGGDREKPIVVYCGAGGRAAKAKAQLETAGYTRVVNGGGLDDLR
jgi:phage shock protein E